MTRRLHSFFEEIIALVARLPWWLYLTIALLSFSFFHWYAGLPLEQTKESSGFLERGISTGLRQAAAWAQYLVPLFVFPAALLAMYQKWKRDGLYEGIARNPSADCLNHLSRYDFQFLVAHYFRRRGFDISKVKVGAEAHAAFLVVKGDEKYLVICESNQIGGPESVKELHNHVTEIGATGGIAVYSAGFHEDAAAFAKTNIITLLDGTELHRNIRSRFRPDEVEQRAGRRGPLKIKWFVILLVVTALGMAAWRFTETGENRFTQLTTQLQGMAADWGWLGERERTGQSENGTGAEREEQYRYEIELHTGGWIYLNDAPRITEETISFHDPGGLDISLNRDEVKTIKRIRVDE